MGLGAKRKTGAPVMQGNAASITVARATRARAVGARDGLYDAIIEAVLGVRIDHRPAVDEAAAAREWYQVRSQGTAQAFLAEIDHAIQQITEDPSRWPKHSHGTRRYLFHKFPFSVIYRETDTGIQVVAVAHGRRRPGYWQSR